MKMLRRSAVLIVVVLFVSCAGPVGPDLTDDDPAEDPINSAPLAAVNAISGAAYSDELLTGSYTYSDTDADTEATSIFRWLIG